MPVFSDKKKSFIVLAALISFHMVLISLQIPLGEEPNYFEKAIFTVFSPIQHAVVSLFREVGNFFNGYLFLRNVQSRNEKLQETIFSLNQENIQLRKTLQSFKNENEIKKILQTIKENILIARVIGLDFGNYNKAININKGSLHGLKKDMIVLDSNGSLVGRVVEPISPREARVQLITDNKSGVSVFSQGKRVMGILAGDGKGQCLLNYIVSTERNIQEGERVFTSGFDGIFPPGIDVGEIISINKTSSLFQNIQVRPYFEFRNLDQLAVLKLAMKELY